MEKEGAEEVVERYFLGEKLEEALKKVREKLRKINGGL